MLRKFGIFKRLNITFVLLLLISAAFITFFSCYKFSSEVRKNTDRYVALLVQNVELKVEDTMQQYEKIAVSFYDDENVIKALQENVSLEEKQHGEVQGEYGENRSYIQNKLYNLRGNQQYIVNIQLITPHEQYYMIETNGFRRGATIRNQEKFYQSDFYRIPQERRGYPVWFDTDEQTEMFYKTEQSVYGLANIVTLCTAVYAPVERDFLGVLVFNIDLKAFSGAMEEYEFYNEGNTFLVGGGGILKWFHPSLQAPSFPKNQELFEEMKQRGQGVAEKKIDGQKVVLAYEAVKKTNMFVVHIVSLDVLLEGTYQTRNLCIAVICCIVVACFVVAYYVTKSIAVPIEGLVLVMQKTGNGKWKERYKNDGHDEITILGDCFNKMADKTDQLIEQVYQSEIRRQEISLNWKNAQLDALLMQINPHFLYNTLDIIRWEAMYEANGESTVTMMIEKFSKLCRMGMGAGGKTITLREGMAHAEIYLEVINFRHKEKIRLETELQVDDEKVYIPQFMLQPIMENSVVHGFCDASRGYAIRIEAKEQDGSLNIWIIDNGKGMSKEDKTALEEALNRPELEDGSIGLGNVNQRIRLFYGEAYGITITSKPETGTIIQIILPVRKCSEDMEKQAEEYKKHGIQSIDC